MSLLIYQQGTYGHSSLQLQCLPVWGIHIQSDGIILDARLGLLAEGSALWYHVNQFTSYRYFTLRLL